MLHLKLRKWFTAIDKAVPRQPSGPSAQEGLPHMREWQSGSRE